MSTSSNELLSQVRSLVHEPRPDATAIIETIQSCPDAHARKIAEQYAHQHFIKIREREGIEPYAPVLDMRMRYDVSSRVLSSPDGGYIKQMCCPLDKQWMELEPLDKQDMMRACESCQRHVYNTRGMDNAGVRELVDRVPDVCLHIDQDHDNVVFVSWPKEEEEEFEVYSGLRSILSSVFGTSRSKSPAPVTTQNLSSIRALTSVREINLSTALGFRPLIKAMTTRGSAQFIQVWQHTRTHELFAQNDPRCLLLPPPYLDWKIALKGFRYDSTYTAPFLAYMIPKHLEPYSRVTIIHAQRPFSVLAKRYGHAIWTGDDLDFDSWRSPVVG